ncbi:MAG: NAD(P)/FAD-dependent oxidoreductase [Actinobacteria bacterium]|nr:NAD(P)/FAD-dependent oxidoreductase [Actinomycetota bacterium]
MDVVVIGAGVLGCMAARELSRYKLDVLVLERAGDIGEGSSKANSGLIHAGFHPRGGSLKGTSCAEGNAHYTQIAGELNIPFKRIGSLFVAFNDAGLEKVEEKRAKGVKNGALDLEMVSGDEARELEPRLSPRVVGALWAPTTGIISPFELVDALAESAVMNGVEFRLNSTVAHVEKTGSASETGWRLILADGSEVNAHFVLNAAGDDAETIDAHVHPADLVIKPRRGQYYVFDKQAQDVGIKHVVYQAEESDEGGTLITPTIEGNLLAGPTSEDVRDYTHTETTAAGLAHVERVATKLFPDLDMGEVIASFAGIRANIKNLEKEQKDFFVRASAPRFVSMLGVKNPGMTSAPALAKLALRILSQEGLELEPDPSFNPIRSARTPFMKCSANEQRALLAQDPAFSHLVCRCEKVTEGDIRRVLSAPLPPTTFDGVKKRLRTGMGRCQASHCMPVVIEVLAREWGVGPADILKGEADGRFALRSVK